MTEYLMLLLATAFVNNVVLVKFLGLQSHGSHQFPSRHLIVWTIKQQLGELQAFFVERVLSNVD